MNTRRPVRRSTHRIFWVLVASLLVVMVALTADLGYQSLAASSSPGSSPFAVETPASSSARLSISVETPTPLPHDGRQGDSSGAPGVADGVVPDGVTVFDDQYPAVANLNPALLGALREAATDAAGDGIQFYVNSGWRSPKYQEQLLQQAIQQYGSVEAATRWVDTPNTSAHVSGDAVDLGPASATTWLSEHGARYGLCQIYRNESWHYELRPDAVNNGCPPMYADPTQDPRSQQ